REDVVEITCHGGMLVARLVLDAVLANGARLAQPGEFTKRAFLNGRIDLAQAEAVADVIRARTELALAAASEQLSGKLSQRVNQLRDEMMRVLAHIEAHLDFPDEDIGPDAQEQLRQRLERSVDSMDLLLRTANEGQILRRGLRAAIVGRPNVGKSSLLNQLLGHDRAIVSSIPGTTRDTIEETANIRGLPVVLIDTAGLRESGDPLEREGIRRSHEAVAKAELILHLFDASMPWSSEDESYLEQFTGKKRLLIRNKIDLPLRLDWPRWVQAPIDVCCVTGQGIESLKDAVRQMVWAGEIRIEMLPAMINARHQEALERARQATLNTIQSLSAGAGLELVAMELRLATNAIGEIVGKTATEDLLDMVFSEFCLGK
ncbi:MAG: tRNA uridine-5-carboxymethylaminomethyl(34) synthesis GTPase MnmE, partial [Candidatus Omnitrophica bacterium]|nr:tRNA uridine-5-carboxymethylaminomethyl(34) synthesis GTPase MnmE [Candidatus Omnitrophota bacterium]